MLKYHRFSLGSFHVIKQEFTSSRILAPWSALQGAEIIKITILLQPAHKSQTYIKYNVVSYLNINLGHGALLKALFLFKSTLLFLLL